ncbi:MAG TPA: hypothetical protein VLT32_23575, partial [Candidatus Sulfomarinibacteraceae bacterium]|nr:hypothetical protein [Candidatus Sulfomarinibacteraceae bacterium]
IGTLAEGKQADLVCISVDGAHATPLYDPFSHLVFAARASDVRHVLIHGKLVVGNRSLNTVDFERIRTEVRELIRRIRP